MKKRYIEPNIRVLQINHEDLLISMSAGGEIILNTSDDDGDAGEALGKSTNIWDE